MSQGAGADQDARVFGAIDVGASGGRVMAGVVSSGAGEARIELVEIHRFPNGARESGGALRWDLTGLYDQILDGLTRLATRYPQTESLGIDTWAVDFGAVDDQGDLLAEPVAYRDDRTAAVIDEVHRLVEPSELYAVNGLQYLPFNTVYQLAAERRGNLWGRIDQVLLIPDLIGAWLTGVRRTEITNASTTGLLDAARRRFSPALFDRLSLPTGLFPPLIEPGRLLGTITPAVADR
ncbi:MAG TPA: FGGY family carbohydrate kinase, partial [Microlunatus sp.]|nr:FGGY family carbohydrate kinase [Microlunatus sp.]